MSFNELSYPFEIELRNVKYESLLDSLVKLGYPNMEKQLVKNLIATKYLTSGKISHLYSFRGFEDKSHEIANEVEKLIYAAQEKAAPERAAVKGSLCKDAACGRPTPKRLGSPGGRPHRAATPGCL